MTTLDDMTRLCHLRDAAVEAVNFAADSNRESLGGDRKLTLALVKEIEIMGEASHKISDSLKNRHPQLPWGEIIGMRNRLVHAYFEIDLDIVWRVVSQDLPSMIVELERIIAEET
jgi:uncharacterized protein with HEPN domain